MANSMKGETPLNLSDGRKFTLVLDMEAMLSIEDRMGKPLSEVMGMAKSGFMSAIAAIAQAAFSTHHPDVTRADVLEMLRTDADALEAALTKATENAFPDQSDGKAGNVNPKPKARRGRASGRSGAKRA